MSVFGCFWYLNLSSMIVVIVMLLLQVKLSQTSEYHVGDSDAELHQLLGRCDSHEIHESDECWRQVFNDLRSYFPTGLPDYNIKPFDPHRSPFVELRRGDTNGIGGFKLILRNVAEFGWTQSEVTKFHSEPHEQRIVYAQYFPEKSLEGDYEMVAKVLGKPLRRWGHWNLTLYDYSQTTSVRRIGEPGSLLKVHVEVDKIGGMQLHVGDLLDGQKLNQLADGVINSMWQLGLPFVKPIINELVSSAFTDIFNESFRYFPLEKFLNNNT